MGSGQSGQESRLKSQDQDQTPAPPLSAGRTPSVSSSMKYSPLKPAHSPPRRASSHHLSLTGPPGSHLPPSSVLHRGGLLPVPGTLAPPVFFILQRLSPLDTSPGMRTFRPTSAGTRPWSAGSPPSLPWERRWPIVARTTWKQTASSPLPPAPELISG